jgi:uncharacterized glyoxalase superfamily protein PhnB
MARQLTTTGTTMYPFVRYEDARAAIEWLSAAFGFEAREVTEGTDGAVVHAELAHGGSAVMLGSARENDWGLRTPRELGGVTAGVYVVVEDVDAHYERARAAGAEIMIELGDTMYGSREYMARDPEGHLWSFGTYRPPD